MKKNKGITLVTLVITIIVMIILAGVTIQVATNADLSGTAEELKKVNDSVIEQETEKEKELLVEQTTGFKVEE